MRADPVARSSHRPLCGLRVDPIPDGDIGAGSSETQGNRPPDAPGSTRDEGRATREAHADPRNAGIGVEPFGN